jgi:hypothetical protein
LRLDRYRFFWAVWRYGDLEETLSLSSKAHRRDLAPESIAPYGETVGLGVDRLAFSLSLAAFAVACCRRSESDFSRSASGVLCGLAVVLSSEREQPAAANRLRARIRTRKFFMIGEAMGMGD